jgi:hypothetical protein
LATLLSTEVRFRIERVMLLPIRAMTQPTTSASSAITNRGTFAATTFQMSVKKASILSLLSCLV